MTVSVAFNSPERVEKIEVTFWNVETGEKVILEFANTADPHQFQFERVIEVPATLSPGGDYRLGITVYPREGDP